MFGTNHTSIRNHYGDGKWHFLHVKAVFVMFQLSIHTYSCKHCLKTTKLLYKITLWKDNLSRSVLRLRHNRYPPHVRLVSSEGSTSCLQAFLVTTLNWSKNQTSFIWVDRARAKLFRDRQFLLLLLQPIFQKRVIIAYLLLFTRCKRGVQIDTIKRNDVR